MSAAAAPVPEFYKNITAQELMVGDIIKYTTDSLKTYYITKIDSGRRTQNIVITFKELNEIDKIFFDLPSPLNTNMFLPTQRIIKINCPVPVQPAAPGASRGGSRSRKRSTSRNRRKLRKT